MKLQKSEMILTMLKSNWRITCLIKLSLTIILEFKKKFGLKEEKLNSLHQNCL